MRTPLTTRPRRVALALAAGALLATGATACEPTEPAAFTVDSAAAGADATPGDGLCATGWGTCTLQAAVEEANALDTPTTITVPGAALPAMDLTVTGAVELVAGEATAMGLHLVSWTVAEGAQLAVTDASLGPVDVQGTFLARRVIIGAAVQAPTDVEALVQVGATGSALLSNAQAVAVGAPLAINAGVLSIHGATVSPMAAGAEPVITTATGGQTRLSATAVLGGPGGTDVCAGEAPTSYGYNLVPDTTCGLVMTGDHQDFDESQLAPESVDDARVDAIPVGTLHCGSGWDDDLTSFGEAVRPANGDDDDTPACDVGAVELPEVTA
jgi:hypothetical protein